MSSKIALELQQKKPFSSPEEEIVVGLQMVAARIAEPWAKYLKTYADLTNNQYNVLRILRGSHPSRLACNDIADRMIDRDPDITRLIDRLEKRGLVKRFRVPRDRRVIEVAITSKGLAALRALDVQARRMPKALLGHLGSPKLRELGRLLEDVISGLSAFSNPARA